MSPADPDLSVVVSAIGGSVLASPLAAKDPSATLGTGAAQWLAPLAPLTPDTVYCYDVKTGSAASERLGFRTAPAAGSGAPVRFIAFGDSGGGGDDQTALRDQMATVPFDFMIHTGDIPYDGGTRAAFEQRFFGVYADYLKYFPVFPASGNHEYDSADAAPFREVFVLPENGGPDGIERWYSYDWGDVHFVALDTERTGPVQAAWLDADLTANQLPWTIVYWHKPPFSSGEHGSDGGARTYFVPILEKHQVPLVLNGHDHDYERTTPQNGVTYVVTGGGGVGVRPVGIVGLHGLQRRGHPLRLRDRRGQRAGAARDRRPRAGVRFARDPALTDRGREGFIGRCHRGNRSVSRGVGGDERDLPAAYVQGDPDPAETGDDVRDGEAQHRQVNLGAQEHQARRDEIAEPDREGVDGRLGLVFRVARSRKEERLLDRVLE